MKERINPYYMPLEQRKTEERHSFAKVVVCAYLFGVLIAIILHYTGWGS